MAIGSTFSSRCAILFVAWALVGGCGFNEPSREAVMAMETFEQLLQSADGGDFILPYEERFAEVRRKYGQIHDDLISIPSKRERIQVATRMERRLLDALVARPSGFGECRFLVHSNVMFHALVHAVWETTGDERRVFALWERRRRKCLAMAERSEREEVGLKEEDKCLMVNEYRVAARMAKVRKKDLTAEERATFNECQEKRPKIAERLRGLYFLNGPQGWNLRDVPGAEGTGAGLAGGKLNERFQKLSQKELDELVRE